MNATPLLEGAALQMSLIIAFGPQNLFVLRSAISGHSPTVGALICSACDLALLAFGAMFSTALEGLLPSCSSVIQMVGGVFLVRYGARTLSLARDASSYVPTLLSSSCNVRSTYVTAIAVSLLNPSVYLDTVVVVGGATAGLPPQSKLFFVSGAMAVSVVWFLSLAQAGRRGVSLLGSVSVRRWIDVVSGVLLAGCGGSLLLK